MKLQTFCVGSISCCSIIGYLTSGIIIKYLGIHFLFLFSAFISLLIFFFSFFNFLSEIPIQTSSFLQINKELLKKNYKIIIIATLISFLILLLTTLISIYQSQVRQQLLSLLIILFLILFIIYYGFISIPSINLSNNSRHNSHYDIIKLSFLLILMDGLTPNLETSMFYWYTNSKIGLNLSSQFIGMLNMIGYFGMFLGVIIFSKYLKYWKYQTLFITSQVSLLLFFLLLLLLLCSYFFFFNSFFYQ